MSKFYIIPLPDTLNTYLVKTLGNLSTLWWLCVELLGEFLGFTCKSCLGGCLEENILRHHFHKYMALFKSCQLSIPT